MAPRASTTNHNSSSLPRVVCLDRTDNVRASNGGTSTPTPTPTNAHHSPPTREMVVKRVYNSKFRPTGAMKVSTGHVSKPSVALHAGVGCTRVVKELDLSSTGVYAPRGFEFVYYKSSTPSCLSYTSIFSARRCLFFLPSPPSQNEDKGVWLYFMCTFFVVGVFFLFFLRV